MRRFAKLALVAVGAIALIVVAAWIWLKFAPRSVPPGQPPLAKLDAKALPAFRAAFNGASESIRLLVLLSPT